MRLPHVQKPVDGGDMIFVLFPYSLTGGNGKFALPANAAPPPSALPPPLASWQGSEGSQEGIGGTGDHDTTQQLGE